MGQAGYPLGPPVFNVRCRNPNRPETGPTPGSGSCRSGVSCGGKRDFDLLDAPGGVRESLPNVLFFDVWVRCQDFRVGVARSNEPNKGPTVTRIPRTQGLPPITSGSRVIRSSPISTPFLFYRTRSAPLLRSEEDPWRSFLGWDCGPHGFGSAGRAFHSQLKLKVFGRSISDDPRTYRPQCHQPGKTGRSRMADNRAGFGWWGLAHCLPGGAALSFAPR